MLGFQGQQGTHRERGRKRGSRLGLQSAFPFRAFSLLVSILGHFLFLFFSPCEKLSHAGILCLEILENRVSSGMRDALRFIYGLHASVRGKGSFITL